MIRFFANHPTASNLLMIALLAIGISLVPTLKRETFPRIEPNKVQVSVLYPGARPEDVEEAICRRIEDAVDGVDNVYEMGCEAREGRATATLESTEGTNLDRFFSDIKTEIDAIDQFPDNAEAPIIRQLGRTDFVASVAVTGPTSLPDLKAYAEDIKAKMLRGGAIPKVEIKGFSDHQLRIEIPKTMLRQFGLSLSGIADTISRQNVDLPAGSIETKEQEILVRFADERQTVGALRDLIVVSGASGGQVRLGDIAKITDRFEHDEHRITFNGKPAAVLDITKTSQQDVLNVIDAVNKFLESERKIAPPGVDLVVVKDMSSIVRDRLDMILNNGAQGLVLVFLAMWLFFGFRYSFWIAMGLPVSFAGAIALMVLIGFSINMLTMVALLIVIGLLMDDAIVISENVATKRQKGLSPVEAAIQGARQVLPGVVSSFLTTVCIFGSLAFLQGDMGQILRVIPIVMIAVLIISLVEAFLILPSHLSHSMRDKPGFIQRQTSSAIEWAREYLIGRTVDRLIKRRYLTAGVAIGLLLIAISAMAGGLLKFMPFPDLDGDTLEVRLLLPQGTPLTRTEQIVAKVKGALDRVNKRFTPDQPDKQPLVRNVIVRYNENSDAYESGPHVATIVVDLLPGDVRQTKNDDIIAAWRKETGAVPDVIALKFTEPQIGPAGRAIDIRLQGENLDALKAASLDLQKIMRRYRGAQDIGDDLRLGKPEVTVKLTESGTSLGLTAQTVADQLRKAFFGTTVSEIQVGREAYEIDARLSANDQNSLADLDNFTIMTTNGDLVPLSAVATLSQDRGYARINRINRHRTISVQGDVDTRIGNANEMIRDFRKRLKADFLKRHPLVQIDVAGQDRETGKTQKAMVRGFLLGLLGVFLLLSFQFRSYIEPVVVMLVIPFAFIGVIVGHLLLGLEFTMPSMLGFLALAGVVVNNSILLVDFIKRQYKPGDRVEDLAPKGARARFRAMLLTSITTVAGLFPLLLETSLQAQVLVPLVTSLAFGLVAASMISLFVVPAMYTIFDDFGVTTLARDRRKKELEQEQEQNG
ncbi:MAG: efflux RND transporter permease subunit [Alphaproteobacteria bacterium]